MTTTTDINGRETLLHAIDYLYYEGIYGGLDDDAEWSQGYADAFTCLYNLYRSTK
jgi:hypothetical protein